MYQAELSQDQLVTFFRLGRLKKFYLNQKGQSDEITFFDAVNILACEPNTLRIYVPENYFHYLETNKQRFYMDITIDADIDKSSSARSNTGYIEKRLKDKTFKNCQKFTEIDEEFLDGVRQMIAQGTLAKKIAQKIKKEIETILEPLEVLTILRKHIRSTTPKIQQSRTASKREVILSGYLMKDS